MTPAGVLPSTRARGSTWSALREIRAVGAVRVGVPEPGAGRPGIAAGHGI